MNCQLPGTACIAQMPRAMRHRLWLSKLTAHRSTSHAKLKPALLIHHVLFTMMELADRGRLGSSLGGRLTSRTLTKIVDRCRDAVTAGPGQRIHSPMSSSFSNHGGWLDLHFIFSSPNQKVQPSPTTAAPPRALLRGIVFMKMPRPGPNVR